MRLPWMAKLLPCAVLLLGLAGQAQAGIIFDGQTVGFQYLFPSQSSVFFNQDITVGAGTETNYLFAGGNYAFLDISDTNIQVDYYAFAPFSKSPFNGIRIFDKYNVLPAFGLVSVNAATNLSGFTQSNVSFDENNIFVSWQGLTANANSIVSLDVERLSPVIVGPGPIVAQPASVVPEPASLAVFGIGGIGMALSAMRRRKQQPSLRASRG